MTRSTLTLATLVLVAPLSTGCSLVLDAGRHMGGTAMDGGGADAGMRTDAPVTDAGGPADGCVSADPCDCDGDHFQAARAGCTPAAGAVDCCDDGTETAFGGCNIDRAQYIYPGARPYCIELDLVSNDCEYAATAGLRTLLNVSDLGVMPPGTFADDAPSGVRTAIALAIRTATGGPHEPIGLGYVGYIDTMSQRARIVPFDIPETSSLEGEPAITPPGDVAHTGVALARVGATDTTVAAHILLGKPLGTDGPFMWAGYFDPLNTDGRGTNPTDLGTANGTGAVIAQSVITRGSTASRHFLRVQGSGNPMWSYGSLPYDDISIGNYQGYPAASIATDSTVASGTGFVHVAATNGPNVLVELDASHLELWDTAGAGAAPFPVLEDAQRTGRAAVSRPGSGDSYVVYPAGTNMRIVAVSGFGDVAPAVDIVTPGAANLVAAAPISRDGFVVAYTTLEATPRVRLLFVSTPDALPPVAVEAAHLGVVDLPPTIDDTGRVFTDLHVDAVSLDTGGFAIVVVGTYGVTALSPRGVWVGGLYGCTR